MNRDEELFTGLRSGEAVIEDTEDILYKSDDAKVDTHMRDQNVRTKGMSMETCGKRVSNRLKASISKNAARGKRVNSSVAFWCVGSGPNSPPAGVQELAVDGACRSAVLGV